MVWMKMHGTRSFFLEPTKYDKKWIGSTHTCTPSDDRWGNEEICTGQKLNPELLDGGALEKR